MRRVSHPSGQRLIVAGNAVGFLFAVLAFALSLIVPAAARPYRVAVAIITSIKGSLRNPLMALGLVRGWRPGDRLAAVLYRPRGGHADPGHSTWHLYRKVVGAGSEPAAGARPSPRGVRWRRISRLTVCCLVTQRRHGGQNAGARGYAASALRL